MPSSRMSSRKRRERIRKKKAEFPNYEEQLHKTLQNAKRSHNEKIITRRDFLSDLPKDDIIYYKYHFVRAMEDYKPKIRSKDRIKRKLDLVRHLFQRYPVPKFLEMVWVDDVIAKDAYKKGRLVYGYMIPRKNKNYGDSTIDWYKWYLAVAQGASLYKRTSGKYMTRKEIHIYLTLAPKDNDRYQNVWWAKAYCFALTQANNKGNKNNSDEAFRRANLIADSSLTQRSIEGSRFWISAMQFFIRHRCSGNDINDYIDFFRHVLRDAPSFSLKGRTLMSVALLRDQWHAELAFIREGGDKKWVGSPIHDKTYVKHKRTENEITYKFEQIKNGRQLIKEGKEMKHCVAAYVEDCVRGNSSIWSVTKKDSYGPKKRALTVQVSNGTVVQARGKTNKSCTKEEAAVLRFWGKDVGLRVNPTY